MSCFPHTLLRTNVTLHVIRRKETTPVSYQTNEPMCTLTLTHVDVRLEKCYHHVHLPNWPSVLACDGEYCPYAPDAAHWGVASPVVDPSLLYVALNDKSGFEPSVYLLLENEA